MLYTDFYELLQVQPEASVEVIRAAYRALAKMHHPDAGGDPEVMKQLNDALEVLTNPPRRAAYDRQRVARHGQGAGSKFASPHSDEGDPSASPQATVTANPRWWQGAGIIVTSILLVVGVTVWTQSGPPTKPLLASPATTRAQFPAPITGPTSPTPAFGTDSGTLTNPAPRNAPAIPVRPPDPLEIIDAQSERASATRAPADTFTLASTKAEVRAVMGSPSSIIGTHWGYGLSSVEFGPQGTITGWSNIEGNLKVYLGDRQSSAPPITLASTRLQVLAAMGTPSSMIGDRWGYGLSSVEFGHIGTVTGWSDIEGNLRIRLGEKKTDALGIDLGSTKAEVLAAMGTPSSIIGNRWGYRLSSVEFGPQATVVGWSDIEGNLKVR